MDHARGGAVHVAGAAIPPMADTFMHRAFVSLGSNIGDGPKMLDLALAAFRAFEGIELLRVSSLYVTEAWGRTDQPDFTNAVAEIDTPLGPHQLLDSLLQMEFELGRKRDSGAWGPRVIDLDLLSYEEEQLASAHLILPHPHMHERAFVLIPLLELQPDFEIPGLGSAAQWAQKLSNQSVQRIL